MTEARPLRSYGRRKGKALSARKERLLDELLPRLRPDLTKPPPVRLAALFDAPVKEVWLEIGFGGGEHLVWQAKANPDVGILGCEPFEDGVIKVLSAIEADGLTSVRLLAGDARPLLRLLPQAGIGRVFILFPDPWPKKRHRKRRLLSAATLDEIARILKPGGELRLATDAGEYASAMLQAALREEALTWTARGPQDWRRRPPDWPQTRYEAKAVAAGRRCYFLRFERAGLDIVPGNLGS